MTEDNKITLHSFTELVARRAKVSSADANTYIHQLAKTMAEGLEKGDYIHLYRFGRFQTTHVAEQAGHNPNSGEPLTIPEHSRVQFHPYSALRFAVNAPFNQLRIRELTPDKTAWRTRAGAWILAALIVVLLILLGINLNGGMSTQDAFVVPLEKASDKDVMAHPDQTSETAMPVNVPATIVDAPAEAEIPLTVKTTATLFIVSPGDTLWAIAETRWGDSFWWPIIYAENRAELSRRNPDIIDSGITLRIPALAGSVNSPMDADIRLKTNAYRIVADDYRKLGNPRASEYGAVAAR